MGRLGIIVLLLIAGVAVAQPRPPEGARLFEEGRELAKQGKYEVACEKFKQSLAIDRAPGTSLNYGDCLEHLGQLRKAFQMYEEAAAAFERDKDARAKFARERAAAVLPKLGTVVLKLADPTIAGLVVEIGSQSVPPQREITERFEPGELVVTARAPYHDPFTASARVVAGATVIIEVPAFVRPPPPPQGPPAPVTVNLVRGARDPRRVFYARNIGITGGAALGLSVIVGLTARTIYNDTAGSSRCSRETGKLVCTPDATEEIEAAGTRADYATRSRRAGCRRATSRSRR